MDTCHADPKAPDRRGSALHELLIRFPEAASVMMSEGGCGSSLSVRRDVPSIALLHGILPSGEAVACDTMDPLIGRVLPGGWWVKTKQAVTEMSGEAATRTASQVDEQDQKIQSFSSQSIDIPMPNKSSCYLLAKTAGRAVTVRWASFEEVERECTTSTS